MLEHVVKARKLLQVGDFFSEELKGWIDYYRFPERRQSWGGPFNGQAGRRAIFGSLLTAIRPHLILETGTYLGSTTELFAQTGLPVVTVENDPRNYGFCRARLRQFRNVQLRLGDSRIMVHQALDQHRIALQARPLFAYLDAHWNADLPLAEELEIIFSVCSGAVVMIDDFQVPDDPGYQYDDYGPDKALTLGYIASVVERFDLAVSYPKLASSDESGARRGCVVLAKRDIYGRQIGEIELLRPATVPC